MRSMWALLAAAVLLPSCGLNEFDVTQQASTTVPGASLLGSVLNTLPAMQGFNSFDLSQSQAFKNQNAQKDHVGSAKLTSFTIQISAPSAQDFAFLDSLAFFAEANGQRVRVAHKENIATLGLKAPNPTLTLDVDDVELAPFVKADTMSITSEVSGRQPNSDTTLQANAVFHVKVGL